jgi:hypothetical protein
MEYHPKNKCKPIKLRLLYFADAAYTEAAPRPRRRAAAARAPPRPAGRRVAARRPGRSHCAGHQRQRAASAQNSSTRRAPPAMSGDLSAYELQRLQNIKRNEAALEALGLAGPLCAQVVGARPGSIRRATAKRKSRVEPAAKKAKRQRAAAVEAQKKQQQQPRRSSRRLRGAAAPDYTGERVLGRARAREQAPEQEADEDDDTPVPVDYTAMPVEPQHLDDAEFEVYVELKAWRLETCRSLQIEAYKIW